MRDEPLDVVDCEVVALHHVLTAGEHIHHSVTIDSTALLVEVVQTGSDSLLSGGHGRATGLVDQVLQSAAVDVEDAVHDANGLLGGLDKHRSGSIAKQRARRAVLIVGHAGHLLGADHNHLLVHATAHIGGSTLQSNQKSGTGSLDVIGISLLLDATVVGNNRCSRRETIVGITGGAYEQVDVSRVGTRLLQQAIDGDDAHVARANGFLEHTALLDTHARGDPLIAGVNHLRQLLVVQNVIGHIRCQARYSCI